MRYFTQLDSPVGRLLLGEEDGFLTSIAFGKATPIEGAKLQETALLKEAKQQLSDFFSGKRSLFTLPLLPAGTDFQKKCWKILEKIPYGTTISYKEEAVQVGGKNYSRAVGMANGKNPIPIIIPCHRVIGSNGNLTGYAYGLEMKQHLLELEGIILKRSP